MRELTTAIHATFTNFKSFLFGRGEDRVPSPIRDGCADLISDCADTLGSEQDQFRCLSAFRLLDSHVIADITKRDLLTIPSRVRETGTPKRQGSIGFTMKGSIRCGNFRCQKARREEVCPHCGYTVCYIAIYWNKKQYVYRKSAIDGMPFDYPRAVRQLENMRSAIDKRTFDPIDWTRSGVKERQLANKALEWLDHKKEEAGATELSFETIKDYKGYVNNYWIPMLGHYDVRDIEFEQLEKYKDDLAKALSPKTNLKLRSKTRKNNLYALHEFFVWMNQKKIINVMPPFPKIKKGNDAKPKYALTLEEQIEGLKMIPEVHRNIFEFGFEVGLRPGETCSVCIKDIDLKRKTIMVQRTWSGTNLKDGTKEDTKLPVPLSERAYEIAKPIIMERMAGIPDISLFEEFLFINPNTARHYTAWTLWDLWKTHVGNVTHYEASRHSFCTQLVESGADVFSAQALMRHADIRSTKAYFHPTSDRLREFVNKRGKQDNVVPIEKKKNKKDGE